MQLVGQITLDSDQTLFALWLDKLLPALTRLMQFSFSNFVLLPCVKMINTDWMNVAVIFPTAIFMHCPYADKGNSMCCCWSNPSTRFLQLDPAKHNQYLSLSIKLMSLLSLNAAVTFVATGRNNIYDAKQNIEQKCLRRRDYRSHVHIYRTKIISQSHKTPGWRITEGSNLVTFNNLIMQNSSVDIIRSVRSRLL